ncbi:MAG TPA: hypothetical protein VF070_14720 [Streptosporangiaceae bacterium]
MTGIPGEPGEAGEPGALSPWPTDGLACAMFGADIAGFTRPDRDEEIQSQLRHALYGMIREACTGSGIPWQRCRLQDRGDGPLVIIPPGVSPHLIIDPFQERLRHLIRRHNRCAIPQARIQIRAAVNTGLVYRDEHGYSGQDINLLCRMLDSRPLRRMISRTGAELALMVSARVHETIVLRHPGQINPACFQAVRTRVKWTKIDAWVYAPGNPVPQPALPSALGACLGLLCGRYFRCSGPAGRLPHVSCALLINHGGSATCQARYAGRGAYSPDGLAA